MQAKCAVVHACAVGGTRRRAVRDSAVRYGGGSCAHAQNGWMKGGRMGGDLPDIEHGREAEGVDHHGLMVGAVGEGESVGTPKVFRCSWLGSMFDEAVL